MIRGLALIGIFVASNVVAAGVMLVLGSMVERLVQSEAASPWIMYAAGAGGAIAAILFVRGALESLRPRHYPRSRS